MPTPPNVVGSPSSAVTVAPWRGRAGSAGGDDRPTAATGEAGGVRITTGFVTRLRCGLRACGSGSTVARALAKPGQAVDSFVGGGLDAIR
jgi:hypothetical protein